MEDNNIGYVITIQTKELGECYLMDRQGVTSKLRGAKIYHDDMYAKSELSDLLKMHHGESDDFSFFSNPKNLGIKKVEVKIFDEVII